MAIQINGKKVIHLGSVTIPVLKGEKGDQGVRGQQGIPGIDGKDGQTPLRGIDYWTTEDKTEIINEIDNKVQNDLQEYYKKTETYNKEEIDNKISLIPKFNIKVVDKLPTSNISEATVYLVKSGEESNNLYTEYIYANGKWEQLGTQKLDLSGFYNKDEINSMLATRDSKIQALEEENRSQADRIKELEEEVEILSGDYKESTVEGESVVIADGLAKSKVKVKGNGNSYQETTEGYQAINNVAVNTSRNGIDFTVNKDGSVTINGTSTATSFIVLTNSTNNLNSYTEELLVMQEKYYLNPLSTKYSGIKYGFRTTDGTYIANTNQLAGASIGVIYIEIATGITINNETVYPMLINGSSETKPYEPYTNGVATPNPNHKQDIEVIDNGYNEFNINAVVQGDLDTNTGEKINDATSIQHSEYMEVDSNESYTITFNNTLTKRIFLLDKDKKVISTNTLGAEKLEFTATSETKYFRVKIVGTFDEKTQLVKGTSEKPYLPYGCIGLVQRGKNLAYLVLGTVYRETGEIVYSGEQNNVSNKLYKSLGNTLYFWNDGIARNRNIFKYSKTNKYLGYSTATNYTFENGVEYIVLDGGITSTDKFSVSNNIDDKTYEPYIEPIVHSIDLAGESLAKATLEDNLNIAVSGEVNLTKNAPEYIITGDENWELDTSNRFRVFSLSALKDVKEGVKSLCNIAKWVNWSSKDNSFDIRKSSIYFKNNYNYTLEEFKAMLKEKYNSGNPVKIIFNTENAETIPLPSIEPIKLFEGTNVFELVTNLGTTLAVTYKVSNKKKILNLEERISALESAVIGG